MLKIIIGIIMSLSLGGVVVVYWVPPGTFGGSGHNGPPGGGPAMAAPEIDPASALGSLTLLAGGLVMLRGRRAAAQ